MKMCGCAPTRHKDLVLNSTNKAGGQMILSDRKYHVAKKFEMQKIKNACYMIIFFLILMSLLFFLKWIIRVQSIKVYWKQE